MVHSSARDQVLAPETGPTARSGAAMPPTGLLALQRAAGNAAVAQHVQRYAVDVPTEAPYKTLMAWMASSNPYAPDQAAKTNAAFTYSVAWVAKGAAGAWTVTPASTASVQLAKDVDMPEWTAKDAKLQKAWAAGITALRAHEKAHEDLAVTWKATLQSRVRAFTMTSTADTEEAAGAEANTKLNAEWLVWLGEHQAAQNKLDPYHVVVTDPYPPPPTPPVPAPAPDAEATDPTGGTDSAADEI